MAEVTVNKFNVYAQIITKKNTWIFDVVVFQHSFELNGLPTCTLVVPVGRNAYNINQVATIHYAINDLRIIAAVEVYVKGQHRFNSADLAITDKFPKDYFRAFRGYVIGTGWRRGTQQAEFTIHCIHWLADLNFSSPVSNATHPLGPNAWYFPANHARPISPANDPPANVPLPCDDKLNSLKFPVAVDSGADFGGNWIGGTLAAPFFEPLTVQNDFWANLNNTAGLKGFYLALSQQDRLNYGALRANTSDSGSNLPLASTRRNEESLRAFSCIEPDSTSGYRFSVPLQMDFAGDALRAQMISQGISKHLSNTGLNGIEGVTTWDKLFGELHADFMYSIVPMVDRALVVPFVPGLRGMVHRQISTNDYESCELHGDMPRPLRCVFALVHRQSEDGAFITQPNPLEQIRSGGVFDNPTNVNGMVLFKHAPLWMGCVNGDIHSIYTTPIKQTIRTIVSTNAGKDSPKPTPDVIIPRLVAIWDRYAHALYVHEMLKNRQGVLTGPVRFDIAPGSIVRIQAAEDKFVSAVLGTTSNYYVATVYRVTTSIDSETCRANTTLHLAHIRTDDENTSDAYSVARHPLWLKRWAGASLVDDPAFAPLWIHD